MAGVNKVILVGNLGKDPEVKYLESGIPLARFSVATSETYKDRTSGERKTNTEWHNVVLWRGLAEVAEKYLKKGSQIYVEGKLRTRSWEDQAGVTKYTTEIVGDTMTMLGGKSEGNSGPPMPSAEPAGQNQAQQKQAKPADLTPDDSEDDLPF